MLLLQIENTASGLSVVTLIGLALTWAVALIKIREWQSGSAKRRQDEEQRTEELILRVCRAFTKSDEMESLILRVCEAFTNSEAYELRRDRAMIATAVSVTDEQFRIRSASFVDAAVDKERREQMEKRLAERREQIDKRMASQEAAIQQIHAEQQKLADVVARRVIAEFVKRGVLKGNGGNDGQ